MKLPQFEVRKARPPGFEKDHWFVLISGQERLDSPRRPQVNGLACFTLRGEPLSTDVRLNSADGFEATMVCQCDFVYPLHKSELHASRGLVSWERQQALKARLKEVFRL